MNMYKRPPLRVNNPVQKVHEPVRFQEGTFLHRLFKAPKTQWHEQVRQPVYQKEAYFSLLKRNCDDLGIEYKQPDIPDYVPPIPPEPEKEPILTYPDQVYLKLKYLKSGIIRVKIDTSFLALYEKYYSKNKLPPTKMIIQAYKSMGFSEKFLEKIKKRCEKKVEFGKKVSAAIDAIFNKEPTKKPKKKKEEVVADDEVPEEEEPDDPDEEDDDPGEDGEMDVEVDEDEEEEQPQEDMYMSDGGD